MSKAVAIAQKTSSNWKLWSAGASLIAVLMAGTSAFGDENITVSHGYNFFGELKYPADFERLNYVNPDAPKGGEISIWGMGTFDSFNLYTRKGRAGGMPTIGHEDILMA
ncbi:MAG: ABC transporter substrate-binding protein, partial [Roseibium sp.]|nr:ABC transporter substrate-binding protein [Roseibium sp.]